MRLHKLFIGNRTAVNFNIQISLWYVDFVYFEQMPGSGTAETHGSSIFNFLESPILAYIVSRLLYIPQKYVSVLFYLHSHQHYANYFLGD